jgi:F-type H+-transporting ATPase subunit a
MHYVKKRYIVLLALLLGIAAMIYIPPVQPPIFVPGEALTGTLFAIPGLGAAGEFKITNTLVALLLADVLILSFAYFVVYRPKRTANDVPKGAYNVFELLFEALYNMAESSAGKWTAKFFPWFMTIILLVLVANWMELIPGVDSIGIVHHAEEGVQGAPLVPVVPGVLGSVARPGSWFAGLAPAAETGAGKPGEHSPLPAESAGYVVVPFVRAAATDLNFTLALALIAMTMVEYYGLKAMGLPYLKKFFNFSVEGIKRSPMALLDFPVGLLELISELARVISFTFRLFGNIFAGQVMLFVLTSLVPVIVPLAVGLLELFVGAIQAAVFGLLTLAFMTQAVTSHHGGEEHAAEAGHGAEAHA